MPKPLLLGVMLLVFAGWLTDAGAQSLGDIARHEEERRKQTASSGKAYTNASLPDEPKAEAAPVVPAASPAGTATSATDPSKTGDTKTPGTTAPEGAKSDVPEVREKRDEKYWRGRAVELRTRREALQKEITQLEGRLKDLESQAAGSPSIARERDLTQAALAKARQSLGFFNDEWSRFELKARSAKVPPEWLR